MISRSFLPLVVGSLLLATAACQDAKRQPRVTTPELNGHLETDSEILVAPDRRFGIHGCEFKAYGFGQQASLLVWRNPNGHNRPVNLTLRLGFRDNVDAAKVRLRLLGDARAEFESQAFGRTLEVNMTVPKNPGGLLRLLLDPVESQPEVFCLDTFEYETEGMKVDIGANAHHRYAQLASFLEFGIAGIGAVRREGALFLGPGVSSFELPGKGSRTFSSTMCNTSGYPATFSGSAGSESWSFTVSPVSTQEIFVQLPAEAKTLTLEVDGHPEGGFLWGAPMVSTEFSGDAPPVILISLDTTRRDVLPPWNTDLSVAPNIAALVEQSTTFNQATAVSSWTLPTHASMFTGLYPSQHRAGLELDHLNPQLSSIVEILRDVGYATTGIAGGELASSRWGFSRGFGEFHDPPWGGQLNATEVIDLALDSANLSSGRPFFLFLNLFDPHLPYSAPATFQQARGIATQRKRQQKGQGPMDRSGQWSAFGTGDKSLSTEQQELARLQYEAEIQYMDHELGRFFAELKARDLFDPSMIVVVADHGELIGEHGFLGHAHRLDPELIDIPLIIKWPGQTKSAVNNEVVSQIHLPSLIARATNVEWTETSGMDLLAPGVTLAEEHESWLHHLFPAFRLGSDVFALSDADQRTILWESGSSCATREGLKWIETPCSEADTSAPTSSLASSLSRLRRRLRPVDRGEDDPALSQEQRDSLKALGYLE